MDPLTLANLDTAARWVRTATEDGAELIGVIGLSLPNEDGGRLPMILSVPDDIGCRKLLALLREIVEQADAGLATEVHGGEGAPPWFREGREPTPEERDLRATAPRGICLVCGESHGPDDPCEPPLPAA